jgi:hypothetical protein
MGLLSWFTRRGPEIDWPNVVVDLGLFTCGGTALGESPKATDVFHDAFDRKGIFRDERRGLELGVEEGRLDHVLISTDRFPGRLEVLGRPAELGASATEGDVVKRFGAPYWRDEDDEETLLFYEDGRVELQFEFPNKSALLRITMMLSPILADPEQRRFYGVDKPWPPAS